VRAEVPKRMREKLKTVSFIVLWLSGCLFAQVVGNDYADDNLDIFLLPKSAALGGADMALDRSAQPLGNPANLPTDSMREVSLSYADYFQNTYSTSSVSYMGPIDGRSAIGISISYLLVPGIELYSDTVIPANVPTASASDILLRVGYGFTLLQLSNTVAVNAGAAINAERLGLIDYTGYEIGADGGVNFLFDFRQIAANAAAGLTVNNMTTSYIRWSGDYQEYAYPHVYLGLGWHQAIPYLYGEYSLHYVSPDLLSNEGVNTTANITDSSGSETVPGTQSIKSNPSLLLSSARWGAEYTLMKVVSVRVGLNDGYFSFGGGIHFLRNRASIDLAYLQNDLAPTYKLSVTYRWF